MSLTVHGIPNCDTVRKARAWLDQRGIAHGFRDYKKAPPSRDELAGWAREAGWERLLNKAGTTFRALPEPARTDLDGDKAIALMAAHPSLIRRPVVTGMNALLIGFDPASWALAADAYSD